MSRPETTLGCDICAGARFPILCQKKQLPLCRSLTCHAAHRTSVAVRKRSIHLPHLLAAFVAASSPGCPTGGAWSGNVGTADYATFESEVYPVLMRDCGYPNCHGIEQRAFQVWGPGRTRLEIESDDVRVDERKRTYARALSVLYTDGSRPLSESPLLAKPLEISAGGATHGGVDRYGRNVYRSQADAGFQVLWRWAQSMPVTTNTAAGTAPAGTMTTASAGVGAPEAGQHAPQPQSTAQVAGTLATSNAAGGAP